MIILAPNYPHEEVMRELREEVGKILNEDEYKIHFEFVEQLSLTYRGKLNLLDQKTPLDFECIENLGN